MRFIVSVVFLATACAAVDETEPAPPQPEEPAYTIPGLDDDHPCVDAGAERDWSTEEGLECAAGFEDGNGDGYDAGRLVCIFKDDYCPECVGDGAGAWTEPYRVGYLAGYRETYDEGWVAAGCEPVTP